MCRTLKKLFKLKKETIELSIYGDNILECERMFDLIKQGLEISEKPKIDLSHIYSPLIQLETKKSFVSIQFYPDYKSKTRWHKKGLLNILVENGANLTEAPDIILTKRIGKKEIIILAIEFSSALPAGNQAWQRSGRALSFSEVEIPYLYITDIGLEELDSERQSKAVRSSNPLVPLSYIKNTQRNKSFTLTVLNPSQLLKIDESIQKFIVDQEVVNLINRLIFNQDISLQIEKLISKTAAYLDSYDKIPGNVNFENWISTPDNKIEALIKSLELPIYNKKIASKTPIKAEMKVLIKDIIPDTALSIYNNIPICFIPSNKKSLLAKNIKDKCYPNIEESVLDFLNLDKPLVVCFVNGFKPRGDDARPDRGLVPFARMLFGFEIDLLAVVFGQAPKIMETLFKDNPVLLAEKNGLWKSILYYSSLTMADSCHWNLKNSEISNFVLSGKYKQSLKSIEIDKPNRIPIKFNENDIDTAIHLTFSSNSNIFESLCNPPGGDWSGIALMDKNNGEHRWMSLPRVSKDAKRPDHIFQIREDKKNYLMIIESKENLNGLTKDQAELGKGLIKYLHDLIEYPASAIRKHNSDWERNNNSLIFDQSFEETFSIAAFIIKNSEELELAKNSLKVNLLIGFDTTKLTLSSKIVDDKGYLLSSILKKVGVDLNEL